MQAGKTGRPIRAGWAVDGHGAPTTDPRAARIPSLSGTAEGRRHRMNGLALAIDIARFGDPTSFRAEVDRLVMALKALPRAAGVVEILMPGERGHRTLERRRREGIPIPRPIYDELKRAADRFGVTLFPLIGSA